MDEKDDIIEKQIADAMIGTTTITYVDSVNNLVEKMDKREKALESRLSNLESDVERLELVVDILDDKLNTMATKQDLREHMNYLEDEFKSKLTKSMYIVFALIFAVLVFSYFF